MNRKLLSCVIILILAGTLTACQDRPAPGDPLPDQARGILKQMLDDNAVLPEYSGLIVVSQTVLQYDADHNGTCGSLCNSIGVVQPALDDRLSRETEQKSVQAVDYERISSQVDDLKKTLKCDQLPQGK